MLPKEVDLDQSLKNEKNLDRTKTSEGCMCMSVCVSVYRRVSVASQWGQIVYVKAQRKEAQGLILANSENMHLFGNDGLHMANSRTG